MRVLKIVQWPDPCLSEVCAPVAAITPEILALADDMLATMYAAPGRGLAGPQVGAMVRLFVMDTTWKDSDRDPRVCINPVLEHVSEAQATHTEGCLSLPGISAEIRRPAQVRMAWTGLDGARQVQGFDGFAAVCVQHELDHLDGVVTLDHLDAEGRAALIAAYDAP